MKNLKTILAAAIMLVATTVNTFATIRYVNNSNPAPTGPTSMHYTNITSAIGASSNSVIDTVLVQGSPNSYGSFAINKAVIVMGVGHNSQNSPALNTLAGDVSFTASGGTLMGFNCNYIFIHPNVGNVSVKRCRFLFSGINGSGGSGTPNNNLLFEGNVIDGSSISIQVDVVNSNPGIIIRNNVIGGWLNNISGVSSVSSFIVNNIFLDNANHFGINNTCTNITVNNNIFAQNPFNVGGGSGIVTNNNTEWGQSQAFPNGGATNQISTNPAFSGFTNPTDAFSYSANFKVNNPIVVGTGTDQTDRGVYGGTGHQFDYNQNGEPAMPLVRLVQITNAVVPAGTPINVNFSAIINQ